MMTGSMMWGPGWLGSGYGLFGMLLMLLFWVLIIVGVVLIVRWLIGEARSSQPGSSETPLDILKKRYARGEIDKEQFENIKRDLM
ncbi:MAG: SHOCT domain-containing protein [Candidatus Methylomirabilales bacterium]